MWVFSTAGFFSVVQKPGDELLTVRSRVAEDLDRLRVQYLPALSPTKAGGGTDYEYRAQVDRASFAIAMLKMAEDIDYSNFKNEVSSVQGHSRSKVYGGVWSALLDLSKLDTHTLASSDDSSKRNAYGGVVINEEGQVLLREPTGHFDGYVWTFPKGSAEQGEAPEAAALREVREESGVEARITQPIEGWFEGGTSSNRFWLMEVITIHDLTDEETQAVKWVTFDEAEKLIKMTKNSVGRHRDLAILEAARKTLEGGRS